MASCASLSARRNSDFSRKIGCTLAKDTISSLQMVLRLCSTQCMATKGVSISRSSGGEIDTIHLCFY